MEWYGTGFWVLVMTSSMKEEIAKDILQVTPAVGTTGGLYFYGIPLAEVVGLASLTLIIIQASYRLWKWKQEINELKRQSSDRCSSSISNSPADSS